ncbi:YjiH family protein [Clostridium grantii]|uniref:Nucleoside recognition GATE domain-containing membrane protein YjiH n=1 Tax=Clostridium grantii DSM 8605 TaxID=1121316 RepID=A0A1M5TQG0_9CLOT|nr:nucleoside recognition domain-containing protein [Clostridium grantii]SHH52900.1 nucleoside recognition GATE domain-containing membrane protein YjiH [Clostridium grantii DSM 8605]
MENGYRTKQNIMKLIIFTAIGVFYYMIPFKVNGETTMCIAFIENLIMDHIKHYTMIAVIFMILLAVASLFFSTIGKNKIHSEYFKKLFEVDVKSLVWRIAGSILLFLGFFQVGPEMIWSEYTGGFIASYLMPALIILFAFALMFISLLLDYGGMELLGGVIEPIFKPLFKLSGPGSLMALIGWFGSGTSCMIVTDKTHKAGRLTTKECSTIIFGFAIISFPVTFVYSTGIGGLDVAYFPQLTIALILIAIISTFILVRIPPISKKSTSYYNDQAPQVKENDNSSRWQKIIDSALKKADQAPSFGAMIKEGLKETFTLMVEVFPMITVVAVTVLVISENTPVFDVMAIPFAPILTAMGLPEAAAAAPSFFTGFADLILPFLGSASVSSQLTKFVICVVAITQVFCMSEGGVILMKSSMNIKFKDLAIIFIVKTVIAIPIAYYFGVLVGIA